MKVLKIIIPVIIIMSVLAFDYYNKFFIINYRTINITIIISFIKKTQTLMKRLYLSMFQKEIRLLFQIQFQNILKMKKLSIKLHKD